MVAGMEVGEGGAREIGVADGFNGIVGEGCGALFWG